MGGMPTAATRAGHETNSNMCPQRDVAEHTPLVAGARVLQRRSAALLVGGLIGGLALATGCSSPFLRSSKATPDQRTDNETKAVRLVRDMARPWGLRPITVEGIGLVTELENTGSDPPASPQRDLLLNDMQRRDVDRPNTILASPTTSLVLVRTQLPAGVQKGDRLDLEVMTPTRSETKSLRNGWLMQTRLQEMAVLASNSAGLRARTGRGLGDGRFAASERIGPSIRDTGTDPRRRGVQLDRSLGLVLDSEHHSVRASAMVGQAVNARFHTYDRGTQRGVATPKRDNFIELAVHRRIATICCVTSASFRRSPFARRPAR